MRGVRHPPSNPSLKLLLAIAAFLVITASAEDEWCASPLSRGGDRAQKCGAINLERPMECCDGYTCGRANRCIPDSDDPGEDKCASKSSRYGIRAQECGGLNLDFPQECCEGHICEEGTFRCIPKRGTDKPKPSGSCASPLSVDGERAQECGAINPESPVKCCDGYTCGRANRCIPDSDDPGEGKCASKSSRYGIRARECGGLNLDFPQECCEGHICEEGTFRCIPKKGTASFVLAVEDCEYWVSIGECKDNPDFMLAGCSHACDEAKKADDRPSKPSISNPSKASLFQTPSTCGGYRSKSQECGSEDRGHVKRCCKGYKCAPDNIVCLPASKDFEPLLHGGDPFVQGRPIELKRDITVVGSDFKAEDYGGTVLVPVPEQAQEGDLLLLFIGGSGRSIPQKPHDFEVIEAIGEADINLTGLYKWYDDDFEVSVGGGYNTFVTLSVIRGVDRTDPVVDSVSVQESASGKDGKAIAPSAYGVKGGVTFAAFAFDDPHIAQLQSRRFRPLATKRAGDDGMAVYVSGCESTGYTEEVFVAGTYQKGGGNDVTMTVTLRPAGGPYNKAP
jgi:hypothetical protein